MAVPEPSPTVVGRSLKGSKGAIVSDELAYARKASGLVRGLSMMDAFAVGFMNQGLTPSIWVTISLGLGVFLGGNLIIAAIISAVLAGIGFPLVWGILGGSMPRSGGEYVYNSRIIHPIYGIAQSFGDAAIWLMWLYVLAPLAVDPGLTITFNYIGWTGAANWLTSASWHTFLIASILNVIGFLFVVFGIRIFARAQKIVMVFGIGGCALIGVVFTFTSRAKFMAKWDAAAAAPGIHGPTYHAFINQVGVAAYQAGDTATRIIPTHTNWSATLGTMVAMSWLFAYAYSIAFIAGEVKRPDKSIIWANTFAILVPFVFMLWFAIILYHTVGFQFLNASAWNDQLGPVASMAHMPYGSNFIDLAVYIIGTASWYTKLAAGIMGFSYVAFTVWWLALSYLAFPRILFAWGMDRMGPKWFTDINPRFASPVKNHILCLVLGQALLILYYTVLANTMQNIVLTGMQVTSVFIPTAIAALWFPYSRRAKGVWDSSPYKKWTFLGLPVIVWGAAVDLVYLGILLYYFIVHNAATATFTNGSILLFVGIWVAGIIWYFAWSAYN
jgi:APA family basic amino acid/polyamine antiporter